MVRRLAALRQEVDSIEAELGEDPGIVSERDRRLSILNVLERASPDLISIVSESGEIVYVSRNVDHVLGYDSRDYLGTQALDYVHEDDAVLFEHQASLPGSDDPTPVEHRLRRSSGDWIWMETRMSRSGADGDESGAVWVTRDISERVRLEKHLNQQKVLHDAVTLVAPVALIAFDDAAGVVTCLGALLRDGVETFRQIRLDSSSCAKGVLAAIDGTDNDVEFEWEGRRFDARFRTLGQTDSNIAAVGVLTAIG